jgi:hypothetical protein
MRGSASHWERSAGEDDHIGLVILIVLLGGFLFGAFVFWQTSGGLRAPTIDVLGARSDSRLAERPGSGYKTPVAQPQAEAQAQPAADVKPEAAVQPTAQPTAVATATPGAQARVAHTDGVGVVLRASPRDSDRMPRGFMDGAEVTVVERQGSDWVRVRGANGQEGWIPAKYLDQ